jgi:hypothetical protein
MTIPRPEFFVLYNGKDDYPEIKTIHLSDSFISSEMIPSRGMLELEVTIFNVNAGYNDEIVRRNDDLCDYVAFIAKVKELRNW